MKQVKTAVDKELLRLRGYLYAPSVSSKGLSWTTLSMWVVWRTSTWPQKEPWVGWRDSLLWEPAATTTRMLPHEAGWGIPLLHQVSKTTPHFLCYTHFSAYHGSPWLSRVLVLPKILKSHISTCFLSYPMSSSKWCYDITSPWLPHITLVTTHLIGTTHTMVYLINRFSLTIWRSTLLYHVSTITLFFNIFQWPSTQNLKHPWKSMRKDKCANTWLC